jgi:hypothetical protein
LLRHFVITRAYIYFKLLAETTGHNIVHHKPVGSPSNNRPIPMNVHVDSAMTITGGSNESRGEAKAKHVDPIRDNPTNYSNGKIQRRHTTGSLKSNKQPKSKQRDCQSVRLSARATADEQTPKPYIHLKSCVSGEREPVSPTRKSTSRRRVSFNTIEIREYVRTLGDNPAVRSGPALSLGWIVVDSCILPLALYEHLRPPRVGPIDLIVPHSIREEMLRKQGITRAEMVHVIRESIRIRQSRNQTLRQLKYREGVIFKTLERMWESTYGRIGPLNKTDKQVELLLQQVKRAEQVRDQLRQAHLEKVGNDAQRRQNGRNTGRKPTGVLTEV